MQKSDILKKFGAHYVVNNDTFVMGTHHVFANHIAIRFKGYNAVLDTCCGAGFMAIALAKVVNKVITFDINKDHLSQAQINAKIAGVFPKIEFIHANVSDIENMKKIIPIDGAFLDPDWAILGKEKSEHTSRLSEMQPPADSLIKLISAFTQNIALRLPKEIHNEELLPYSPYEAESFIMDRKLKFFTVYFGELRRDAHGSTFEISSSKLPNRFK